MELLSIGYTKGDGLILLELNRTIDIQEGDVVFFNGKKLFHDVEKFKGCKKSIICYSHESNFKDKKQVFDLHKGEAMKLYKK